MVKLSLLGTFIALATFTTTAPSYGATTEYHLKTKVICGDQTKDGLYVSGYHISPSLNDVTLGSSASSASKGFLNGTYQQFNLNTGTPSGLILAYSTSYAQWLTAEIDVSYGDGGFSFNGGGLISSNPEWAGRLACDWWHGVPQLFWQNSFRDIALPSSCAKVELHQEDI